jgi:hypothetical protein
VQGAGRWVGEAEKSHDIPQIEKHGLKLNKPFYLYTIKSPTLRIRDILSLKGLISLVVAP